MKETFSEKKEVEINGIKIIVFLAKFGDTWRPYAKLKDTERNASKLRIKNAQLQKTIEALRKKYKITSETMKHLHHNQI